MRRPKRQPGKRPRSRSPGTRARPVGLRIVGGKFRGRNLHYDGDPRVRPMKDRIREAVFNLVGPAVKGKQAVDLFAGTGALALEALSRGAARATLVEEHVPTAATIERNIELLGVGTLCQLVKGNVFAWYRRKPDLSDRPWLVFSSPPYDYYVQRLDEMLELLNGLIESAPTGSIFVVESDRRFDFGRFAQPESWEVRSYPPAVVGIFVADVDAVRA